MKLFKNIITYLYHQIDDDKDRNLQVPQPLPVTPDLDYHMNLRVLKAQGGTIVTVHQYYNGPNGRELAPNTYIITEDQNLGDSISKILTVESARR